MEQGASVSDVAYHVNWPSNADPWNVANTADPSTRVGYYGIWGVSATAVDGDTFIVAESETNLRSVIQTRLAMPSHIWMGMSAWADAAGDSVFMQLRVVADSAFGTGNKLYMAVTENYERWASPSPNGQTEFYGALYKMYPNATGIDFTHSGSTADTATYTARFGVRHTGQVPMQLENIKLLAWAQNTATKDVLQSKIRNFALITSPHVGDTLYVNVPTEVSWLTEAFTGNLRLQVNHDYPTGTWETALDSLPNTGTAEWTVSAPAGNHVRFRLFELADTLVGDTSKGDVLILPSTTLSMAVDTVSATVTPGDTLASSVLISNTGSVDAHVSLTTHTGTNNYSALTSDEENGPNPDWVAVTSGTAGPTGDDAITQITLPFQFPFYGVNYNRIWMCTNGWFSFSNPGTNYYYTNSQFPLAGPNTFVAVFWDDLNVTGSGSGTRVWSDTTNHRVIIAWLQTQRYSDAATRINAEAILYRDGRMEFQYGTMTGTVDNGTVGIQNATGSLFTQVVYNTAITTNWAVAFSAQRIWARPTELTFTIPSGGSHTLPLVFDARNYTGDTTLTGSWTMSGNLVPVTVPVRLTVQALGAKPTAIPLSFAVSEAYPNPFNPNTTIDFTLEKASQVKLTVYDVLGREVSTVLNTRLDAGNHRQMINMQQWATGVYFLKVSAGEHQVVRKLMLLK